MKMIYWVIYDIKANKNRNKISGLCKDFGLQRIQYSAFLGTLTKNKAEMLSIEAKRFLADKDKLMIIPAGKEDFDKKIVMGEFDPQIIKNKEVIFVE